MGLGFVGAVVETALPEALPVITTGEGESCDRTSTGWV